ncbi:MAG: GNAT family N-acetyltransferase [Pseudomonadota bacterium]
MTRTDPRDPDAMALITAHITRSTSVYPSQASYVLDAEALARSGARVYLLRRHGTPVAIGALRDLGATLWEIKSMHTKVDHRGVGHGRVMLAHLIAEARAAGCTRLCLETGSDDASAAARALYANAGFRETGPFADYPPHPLSVFMDLAL